MTTNTDPVRALAELVDAAALMLCEIDTCGHPVDPAYRATLHDAWTNGQAALAQQPAAPSGEAVGAWVTVPRIPTDAMLDAMHGRIRILCNPAKRTADIQNDVEVWGAMLEAAPQQPEARGVVDDAMVDRAGQALYGTDWGSFEGWEADQLRRKVRAVLTAALSAQQQGGA